jgi:hypothetical protein
VSPDAAVVDRLLADPPPVHSMSADADPELGVSTALFAALGAKVRDRISGLLARRR